MSQQVQISKPTTLQLDKAFSDLSPTESFYLLNHLVLLSVNGQNGNNTGKGKPLPANSVACDINQPAGEIYTIGGYRSPLTNELYSWHYNSNNSHYVLRTSNNGCEVVYHGCLNLSAEPKHSIEDKWRGFMRIEKICNNRHGKQLIWANGDASIGQLDTEASIATDFFTTPFFDLCPDPCAYVQMCVPEICGCIQAEFIPLAETDIGLSNYMLDAPFQFAIKHVYYDLRESEWSDRSSVYYQDAKGCFDNSDGFPRCLKLRVPIGNPMVDKIKIGFTTGLRNETGGLIWYLYDTVEKYKKYNDAQQKWYDRELAELINYSDEDCSFDYIFCNDKGRQAIDQKEMSRVRNPIPQKPQGILPVKDSIGFFNYIDGNCPVDQTETEKFDIQVSCPDADTDCSPEYVDVTVRAVIHNTRNNFNQFVYRQEGDADDPDDKTDTAYFGGVRSFPFDQYIGFDQQFKDDTRNFIAYVEGTEYWAEAKQWKSSPGFVTKTEVGVLSGMATSSARAGACGTILNGQYYFQEFIIRVKRGTRGFIRLTSHHSVDGSGDSQNKSTYVVGIIPNISAYSGTMNIFTILEDEDKELYFDTCDGDVVLTEALIIADNAVANNNTAYSGYITDGNGFPVEGALIYKQGVTLVSITDHNGFYNFYSDVQGMTAQVRVETTCSTFGTIQTMSMQGTEGAHQGHDETITSPEYKDDYFLIVKQTVEDCNGIGVPGVRVSVSGSKYKVTDSAGVATFHLRNYAERNRVVTTVAMDRNGCLVTDCAGNCTSCMPTITEDAPVCFFHTPTLTMADMEINRVSTAINGLKAGGRYGYGIVAEGDCGKLSAVYEVKYVDIPKTQEKEKLNFCNFSYDGNGISLPGFKCLKIVRTINLNPFQLQWKIDKIERTTDSKIKLTIQSLNDYNTKYFNQTNTVYQWLKGDRVEFIYNGDGSILTIAEHGLLNYLTISPFNDELISGIDPDDDANFFNQLLISDDGKLDDVTEGAIIELQRPKTSTTEQIYYQICATILVNPDGSLAADSGTFSTFDTFLVNRNIGSFTGTFEHHSPSDFWGDRVADTGKAFVINPYENERRYGRNISINSPTQFNYFGDLVKRFDAPQQGDIIAMDIKDGKIILAICEFDNFLAESADDLVRVGGDGVIRALPPDAIISDAQPKIYGAYGCQYDHIGSIHFGDGYCTYNDISKSAYVLHDYNIAKDVSEGRTQSFFRIRSQEIETHNRAQTDPLNKYRFAKGYNNATGMEYLTIKRLRDNSINNQSKPYLQQNDTISYHPIINEWFGFCGFVPEFYGNLDLFNQSGCAFITFSQGIPFIHPIIADRYNEFFGVPCDEIMGVVGNKFPEKQKGWLAIEMQTDMGWFAEEITNGKSNFISEIPMVRWKKNNDKWNASFLFNKNSRSGLYGNNGGVPDDTRGWYVAVTLKRDNTLNNVYNSVNDAKRVQYNETDNIFLKCQLIEESGFTNNI